MARCRLQTSFTHVNRKGNTWCAHFLPLAPLPTIGPRKTELNPSQGPECLPTFLPRAAPAPRGNQEHKVPLATTSVRMESCLLGQNRGGLQGEPRLAPAPPLGRWGRGNRGGKYPLEKPKDAPRLLSG
jgi:hypothetical protein